MSRPLLEALAMLPRSSISGVFQRHVSPKVRDLVGSASGGRWGPPGSFPVLYLGRPPDSVIIEAYRHLVEPVMDGAMKPELVGPRRLLTCSLDVHNIIDLRTEDALLTVGLTPDRVMSPVGDHAACQDVGKAAHQLECHGIISTAASGIGETLALFERHLPENELPVLLDDELWDALPSDPRRLRAVDEADSA